VAPGRSLSCPGRLNHTGTFLPRGVRTRAQADPSALARRLLPARAQPGTGTAAGARASHGRRRPPPQCDGTWQPRVACFGPGSGSWSVGWRVCPARRTGRPGMTASRSARPSRNLVCIGEGGRAEVSVTPSSGTTLVEAWRRVRDIPAPSSPSRPRKAPPS